LIFKSQRRYDEESPWTIQPYGFSVAWHIVWLIVRKGTNWSPSLKSVSSSGSPKESRVSDRPWDPKKRSAFTSRDVIFDEESMLQEKSEMEDKAQGGASDSSEDTQEKKVEFLESPKKPERSKRTPQIQMETNRRLLKSNLDR